MERICTHENNFSKINMKMEENENYSIEKIIYNKLA